MLRPAVTPVKSRWGTGCTVSCDGCYGAARTEAGDRPERDRPRGRAAAELSPCRSRSSTVPRDVWWPRVSRTAAWRHDDVAHLARAGRGGSVRRCRRPPAPAPAAPRHAGAAAVVRAGGRVGVGRVRVPAAVPVRWLPVLLGLGWLAVAAGAVDVLHRRLPDALTLPALPVALLLLVPLGGDGGGCAGWWARSSPCAAHGAVHLVAPAAMGGGDVKLAAPLGAVLGRGVLAGAGAGRGAGRGAHRRCSAVAGWPRAAGRAGGARAARPVDARWPAWLVAAARLRGVR